MRKILGFDIGMSSLGIASCDNLGIIASPLTTIKYSLQNKEQLINIIREIIQKHQSQIIVYGMPYHMSGEISATGIYIKEIITNLQAKLPLSFIAIDERLTSQEANRLLIKGNFSRKHRRQKNDEMAAALILQTYLDGQHLNG